MLGELEDPVRVAAAGPEKRAALRLAPRDLVEDLLALAGELHRHDRLAVLVEVRAGAGELQLAARHLRDRIVREVLHVAVLEEVEARRRRATLRRAEAVPGRQVTADDRRVVRDTHDVPLLRNGPAELSLHDLGVEQRRFRRLRPRPGNLLVVEQVPLRRRSLVGERDRLGSGEQIEQAAHGDRLVLKGVDGGAGQVGLEVVELQDGRLADQLGGDRGILDACELNHDLILALLPDLGLGHAKLVDAVPHDRDRAVDRVGIELVTLLRNRLEHDLETALEVEAERQLSVRGRAGHGQQSDAGERGDDEAEQG